MYTPPVISSEGVLGGGDNQLVRDTPSETICPNLTTIKLSRGCISAQDGKVVDMVESRWLSRTKGCPIMQLRTAAIGFFTDACHTEDLTRLEALNVERFGITLDCDLSGVKFRFLYMSKCRRVPMGVIPVAV